MMSVDPETFSAHVNALSERSGESLLDCVLEACLQFDIDVAIVPSLLTPEFLASIEVEAKSKSLLKKRVDKIGSR